MSQSGYQKFFKEAMKNSPAGKSHASNPRVSLEKTKKFVTADELDQLMRVQESSSGKLQLNKKKSRHERKMKTPPRVLIALSLIGFVVVLGAMYFDDELEHALSKMERLEISFFGMTAAQAEKSETSPTNPTADAKKDAGTSKDDKASLPKKEGENKENADAGSADKAGEKVVSTGSTETDHLLTLAQRKKELDERDEEVKQLESQVQEQKKELEKKIVELEEMRRKIASILEERVKVDEQKIDTLVQMYSTMRAPQAAKIFETMDEGLVVEILGRMKKKNAADVMNLIKAEKAQIFSERLAGYRANK